MPDATKHENLTVSANGLRKDSFKTIRSKEKVRFIRQDRETRQIQQRARDLLKMEFGVTTGVEVNLSLDDTKVPVILGKYVENTGQFATPSLGKRTHMTALSIYVELGGDKNTILKNK